MDAEINNLVDRFNKVADDVQRFTFFSRGLEFQKKAIVDLGEFQKPVAECKKRVVEKADNDSANFLLGISSAVSALRAELEMFVALKEDRPSEAWDSLIMASSMFQLQLKHTIGLPILSDMLKSLMPLNSSFFRLKRSVAQDLWPQNQVVPFANQITVNASILKEGHIWVSFVAASLRRWSFTSFLLSRNPQASTRGLFPFQVKKGNEIL